MKTIKVKFVDFGNSVYLIKHIERVLKQQYILEYSDSPDYLFFSIYSDEHLKYESSVKIFVTEENISPDFNICDYAIGPERIHYADRYLRFPVYCFDRYKDGILSCVNRIQLDENIFFAKTEFCSFVYSNFEADVMRENIFFKIQEYKKVNSGGRYLNNIGEPNGVSDKLEFQKKHKFAIACENSSHPGYTTEKLTEAYEAYTIPIYWGDPDVGKVFNPASMINVMNYQSLDALMEDIVRLDSDNKAYLEMINQPVLLDNSEACDEKNDALLKFLIKIFEQEFSKAYRRNRVFWGRNYYNKIVKWKRSFDILTLNVDNDIIKSIRLWCQNIYHVLRKFFIIMRKKR